MAQFARIHMSRLTAPLRFDGWDAVRMAIVLGCAATLIFAGQALPFL